MEVFAKNHQAPFSKMLTFYRKEPFELVAEYDDNNLPHPEHLIGEQRAIVNVHLPNRRTDHYNNVLICFFVCLKYVLISYFAHFIFSVSVNEVLSHLNLFVFVPG